MERTIEETGAKMDALGMWDLLAPYNWAVKPHGTAFPYFCNIFKDQGDVKVRFLMLEGWRTLHDFVHLRADRSFGVVSSPLEFPHFEMCVYSSGAIGVFRHDTGFVPRPLDAREKTLVAKILWEAYGVMLRVESDRNLPMRFAAEKSVFSRVESSDGVWKDEPLEIPDPQPYVERISFKTEDIKKAKDMPLVQTEILDVDFAFNPALVTTESRARSVYSLFVKDPVTGNCELESRDSVCSYLELKKMWERMPQRFLEHLLSRGRVPGRVRVVSGRVFRFLRPLCIELPFRLSLHDKLPDPK